MMARHAPEPDREYSCTVTPTILGWLWRTTHHAPPRTPDRLVQTGRVDGPTTGRKGLRGRARAERRATAAAAADRARRRYLAEVNAGESAHTWTPAL